MRIRSSSVSLTRTSLPECEIQDLKLHPRDGGANLAHEPLYAPINMPETELFNRLLYRAVKT